MCTKSEEIGKLKKQIKILTKKNAKLNEEMQHFYETTLRSFLGNVNQTTQTFITTQISEQRKGKQGRRYSNKFKVIALSLQKQANKGYELMQRMGFALPSRRCLSTLLQGLPLKPGITDVIFEKLKLPVSKMNELDKTCVTF